MPDEVQKTFIRSILGFLKKQLDGQALTPDAQESVEVAMQCLQAAFDIEEAAADSTASGSTKMDPKEIDLFEMFQSLYIERNPQSLQLAEKIKNEGNQLMKDGKFNEALLQYNRAITFDPKNPIFYCNRAAAYIRLGDNERAITDCKSALVYNANYGKAYGRLGIAYSNLGKFEEAQQAYAKAIELEPDNQDYKNNLEVARNARSQTQAGNPLPQLTEGLNMLLSNPAIHNLMNNAGLDLTQLHTMSQNPMVMNAVGQMFSALQASGMPAFPPPQPGTTPTIPNEILEMIQSMANQVANSTGGNTQRPGDQPGGPQPPPPANS